MARFSDKYLIDPVAVADAMIKRIDELADARAKARRSMIYSVEMIEAPDFDIRAGRID